VVRFVDLNCSSSCDNKHKHFISIIAVYDSYDRAKRVLDRMKSSDAEVADLDFVYGLVETTRLES
jgi:hypothetical protein